MTTAKNGYQMIGSLTEEEIASIKEEAEERRHRPRGLYPKYLVARYDGRDREGEKHHDCDYFVLDLTHDPFAVGALLAYTALCETVNPSLANDLRRRAKEARSG